ncbi:hypothetical protein DLAC_10984 [Tieghemostelium lacteum]|uniref:Uncharacterized protein n=1 Tax=Tieghemostelium lacteum TaxID=361077 RepID=A0A151Z2V8_TIELA|nr:hypothetical protein DLAC_10984 [Tieghemostelium lacteum]|eukprot:KYQ88290.1 hypothetical protein DLAC_10984 [Tieghemostelium lacteum]
MNFYRVYFNGNSDSVNADGVEIFSQLIDKIRERPQLGVPNQRLNLLYTDNIDFVNNNNCDEMQLLQPFDSVWINGNLVHPGGLNSYIYVCLDPILPVQLQVSVGQVRVFVRGNGVAQHLFAAGSDWDSIARGLHLSHGNLKVRGDPNNIQVMPPYPAGDYEVINAVPSVCITG